MQSGDTPSGIFGKNRSLSAELEGWLGVGTPKMRGLTYRQKPSGIWGSFLETYFDSLNWYDVNAQVLDIEVDEFGSNVCSVKRMEAKPIVEHRGPSESSGIRSFTPVVSFGRPSFESLRPFTLNQSIPKLDRALSRQRRSSRASDYRTYLPHIHQSTQCFDPKPGPFCSSRG